MKRYAWAYVILFYSSSLQAAPSEGRTQISLKDAKAFAVRHNFGVQSFAEKSRASHARMNRAQSSFYPTFGVAGGAEHEASGSEVETVPVGYAYGKINLFNGFRDIYRIEEARLDAEMAQIKLDKETFRIELDVEEQFHRYLYYQDLIAIKEKALKKNSEHQKMVARTQSMGQASQTDVMEFDLKESVIQSELISLKQGREKARIHLRRLLGEEIGNQIEPVGNIQHQHVEGDLMTYLDKIRDHSIPIQFAAKQQARASLNAKAWRAGWLPRIDFQAQAGYLPLDQRPTPADGEEPDMAVNFQLIASLDLFSGTDTHWEKIEAQHNRASASLDLKETILTSITDMEESFRELKTIEQRVDLELGNEGKSRKYYESVRKEYLRGYKNSADLSNAADRLFETIARQTTFKFEFLKQRLAFERSLGAPIQVTIIDETPHDHDTKGDHP